MSKPFKIMRNKLIRRLSVGLLPLLVPLMMIFDGCHYANPSIKHASKPTADSSSLLSYAKGFAIFHEKHQTRVVVYDPWQKGKVLAQYYLVKGRPGKGQIHIPLNKAAVFSATQLDALDRLDLLSHVMGVSEATYIKNKSVQKLLKQHKITELAASENYYIEKIIEKAPQAIFFSPYQGHQSLPTALSSILAIPYLDFMESSPLGRAEWIKFTAAFFGKQALADSLFNRVEKQYNALLQLTDSVSYRPTVFSDKYFNGQWYIAGGRSYIARLFRDAGADYIWKDNKQRGSFPLDFETVFTKAQHADFWRIVGTFGAKPSYTALASENKLYTNFKAYRLHHILYCDPEATAYFETSPLEPQEILADFIKAFHPGLLPHYKPHYYKILP